MLLIFTYLGRQTIICTGPAMHSHHMKRRSLADFLYFNAAFLHHVGGKRLLVLSTKLYSCVYHWCAWGFFLSLYRTLNKMCQIWHAINLISFNFTTLNSALNLKDSIISCPLYKNFHCQSKYMVAQMNKHHSITLSKKPG